MEGIYLIHIREFIKSKENVLKMGRSDNLDNRVRQYPKGSNILFMMKCKDSILCEQYLLNLFNIKFTHKSEYGKEFFEGNEDEMIDEIYKYLHNYNKNYKKKELEDLKILEELKDLDNIENNIVNNIIEKPKEKSNQKSKEKANYKSIQKPKYKIKDKLKDKLNDKSEEQIKKNQRTCPKCKYEFKYPSLLKSHFRKAYHCLIPEEEIATFFNDEIKNDKQCQKCKKIFCQISALSRHHRETKCGKSQTAPASTSIQLPLTNIQFEIIKKLFKK